MARQITWRILAAIATAVLLGVGGSVPAQAAVSSTSIPNDTYWYDAGGQVMNVQGGSILKVGAVYYWAGIQFAGGGSSSFGAVNLYRSTDLVNWTWVKALLTPQPSGDLAAGRWVGRPDLIFNPTTNQYILVLEIDGSGSNIGPGNKVGFATSSAIDGNYNYLGSTAVNGSTMGDHSVFVEGNNAYLIYSGDTAGSTDVMGRNASMNIAPLSTTWTSVQPAIFTEPNGGHEAPFVLKVGSSYHWFTSGTNWWASTATKHRVSTSLTSWPAWSNLATTPASNDSFNTQFDFILPVQGTSGTSYIYAGDRYTNFQGQGYPAPTGSGRNAWMPLTFDGDTPTLHGYSDLTINVATGDLSGNVSAHARFDNEGPTQTPTGWQEWGNADASYTESGGVTGNRLTFWASSAFQTYDYQTLTGLANGTYTLSVQVEGSGTQSSALLVAKNFGSTEVSTSIIAAGSGWTTKSITFTATNGTAEIAIYVNGTGGSWLSADNVSLIRN